MTSLQKKTQNESDNFNIFPEFDFTVPVSFKNLFGTSSFIFWLGYAIICSLLLVISLSKFIIFERLVYKCIVMLLIITMFFWVNLRVNIKKNIIVVKVRSEDSEQIIFKKEKIDTPTEKQKNNKIEEQLNLITPPNDDAESFDKDSVKKVFKKIFLKSLDDVNIDNSENDPIEGPYIYNKEAHVYYINIKTNKPLLSGLARWEQNYRPMHIKDLINYNEERENRRMKYEYNDNIIPILFELNTDFLTEEK